LFSTAVTSRTPHHLQTPVPLSWQVSLLPWVAPHLEQVAAFWQPVMDKVSQLRKEYAEKPLTLKDAKRIQKDIEKEEKKALKEQKNFEKEEKKRIEEGRLTMYEQFESYSFMEIEELLLNARTREEKAFYRSMLNLKLQIEQEKVIGEVLL
jgi:hypothetical protein